MEREHRAKRRKPTLWRFGDSMGPCLECDGRDDDRRCRYASKEACETARAAPLEKDKETRWDVLSTALKQGFVFDDVPTMPEWKEEFLVADGMRLQDLSEEDRNNEALVRLAVRQNGLALEHASDEAKGNRKVVLLAVRQNGLALEHASDGLKGDEGVVLTAVEQNGLALEHASDEAKGNRKVVLLAVRQNGLALEHASDGLKGDEEVARIAVEQNPNALGHSPFWRNREWMVKALQSHEMTDFERFEDDYTYADDKEVMEHAVEMNPENLVFNRESISERLRGDRDIITRLFYGLYYNYSEVNEDGDREVIDHGLYDYTRFQILDADGLISDEMKQLVEDNGM